MIIFLLIFSTFILIFCWKFVSTLLQTLYWTIVQIWKHYKVDVPMQKNGFLEKKKLEERMIKADKEQYYKNQVLEEQNKIIAAGLRKRRELMIKYTYADGWLFELFLRKYPVMSVIEIEELEQKIKDSHIRNELLNSVDTTPAKIYTMESINGLEPLEEDREDPIIMRIYKIGHDYLLYIKDIDTNRCQLLQSKDYFIIGSTRSKILEQQRQLKMLKQNIKAEQIVNIFKETEYYGSVYRRNRLNFLD